MEQQQPSVITLNKENSIQILIQYIEIAQKVGAFELREAEVLKRAVDVLVNKVVDNEINENLAINLLIQGVMKGQKHGGAYTLNDAALLQKVVQYIVASGSQSSSQPPAEESATPDESVPVETSTVEEEEDDDDLTSLSDPVPLKPKEI